MEKRYNLSQLLLHTLGNKKTFTATFTTPTTAREPFGGWNFLWTNKVCIYNKETVLNKF
jgi:hypothetical protein